MTNEQNPKLFWLASYPKSGNTWTRAFIANLRCAEDEPIHINELGTGPIASSREWVGAAFDFDINELSPDEVDRLRPLAYEWLSNKALEYEYHKTHDGYVYVDQKKQVPMFPVSATAGALVIVRNPLDVVISYAHHNNQSSDKTIAALNSEEHTMCGKTDRTYRQLRQSIGSWSAFNRSWIEAPVHKKVVRYEDMKTNPIDTFTGIAKFLQLPDDRELVGAALQKCRIDVLQAQENETPFREKSIFAKSFFRKGAVGDWREQLSSSQVRLIVDQHHEMMFELGYINEEGELL